MRIKNSSNNVWDYREEAFLGKGDHGEVYRVLHLKNHKAFAIKKISISHLTEPERVQAFNLAKNMRQVRCEHLIEYIDCFMSIDCLQNVMEYSAKGSLLRFVKGQKERNSFIKQSQLWSIFEMIAEGVNFLHEKKIVHRNIKLENIFWVDNRIKIGDLEVSIVKKTNQNVTTRVGNPLYFAPEIIRNEPYSFPADIWAMGCAFHYLAALEHPYKLATIQTIPYFVLEKGPGTIKGHYSPQLISFISSILKVSPQDRPTISDVLKLIKIKNRHQIRDIVKVFNVNELTSIRKAKQLREAASTVNIKGLASSRNLLMKILDSQVAQNQILPEAKGKRNCCQTFRPARNSQNFSEFSREKSLNQKADQTRSSLMFRERSQKIRRGSGGSFDSPIKTTGFSIRLNPSKIVFPMRNRVRGGRKQQNPQVVSKRLSQLFY